MEKSATPEPPNPGAVQAKLTVQSADTARETQATMVMGVTTPETPDTKAAPPAAFGRYEVRGVLGVGSFGTVYLGHDAQLDRPVAIKVLHLGVNVPTTKAERLLLEARKLARLHHSGIVTVHDVGTQDGQIFVVSNYLGGQDLAAWLKQASPNWRETATIIAAVCDALAHAHAHLTIHRDVKPANIILTTDRTPVLVDFGLALDDTSSGVHELGRISGTPAYMAPEQFAGTAHRIDGRTDIYCLGVVLYEMLCRHLPFRASEIRELIRQVRDDEPQPPRQLAPDIPPELEKICLKALAKGMQDRYATAVDFAADLRRVLQTPSESFHSAFLQPTASGTFRQSDSTRRFAIKSSSSRPLVREAERRQVTVLVCGCEMFEAETYLELDAEIQSRILAAFGQQCDAAVRRFEGAVVQCDQRGLLACFGYPVAQEDAARRAARTGLAMLDDLQGLAHQLRQEHGLTLNPWIAIHTGPALVETNAEQISLVGEARNVALRLEHVAVFNQVICTAEAQRLFRGRFQCASLGFQKVKGVSQAVELFRVEKIAVAGSLIEAVAAAELSPLTGRDHEIDLLKDRWEQAQDGMGQVVLLVGEPGLGKSRLVHTLKEHVLGQMVEGEVDAPVIEWRCSPHHRDTGLHPAIDFYERALDFRPEESAQDRFDRLLDRIGQYDLARPEAVPLWAALLSLPTPEQFPPLSWPPARQRDETFQLMLEWLHVRAARKPVLFVVEDLHWADASTLEFLGQVLAEFSHDRVLTLLTFRPEFKPPWDAVDNQSSLSLTRLTRRQVGELMRKKAGHDLSEADIEQVYDRAGGIPLFVEEFTKVMHEGTALEKADAGGSSSVTSREIPSTLQDLVMARLDRMEGGREVAQIAAVLGREVSHELLTAVAGVEEPVLAAELAVLAQAEILFPKGRPPRCTYIFKHALLVDALYNALVKTRRQELHRRVAEVLESQFAQTAETQPELLGYHFAEAGLAEKAIAYWFKAAQRSRKKSANCEAIGHLTKGLTLLNAAEETPERDRLELQFLTTLAPTYIAARGYAAPEVGPILLRARELCQRIGEPEQLFGIMLGMWEWRLVRGELRLCMDLAADGQAFAESRNDPGMQMEAIFMPGVTLFYRGHFAAARACYENALTAYDDRGRTRFWTAFTGHDAGVTHRCYLALTLWHLGYPDQAVAMAHEAIALARTIGHAFSLAHAVDFAAFLFYCCRIETGLQAMAAEELSIGTEQGFPFWHALGTLHRGAGLLLQGTRTEALPLLLKGFDSFRASGAQVRIPAYLGMLGDAYTQAAQFDDARNALNEALTVVEKNDDHCHEAELYRLQGELVLAEKPGQIKEAEVYFRKAIDTARGQQSRAWELRATISLARLWQREGRHQDARNAVEAIHSTFTEGLATPDLIAAAALLKA